MKQNSVRSIATKKLLKWFSILWQSIAVRLKSVKRIYTHSHAKHVSIIIHFFEVEQKVFEINLVIFTSTKKKASIIPAVSTSFILKGDLVAFQQNIATFFVYVYYLDHFSSGRCSAISTGTICHFQCFLCRLFPAGPCLSTYAIIARI